MLTQTELKSFLDEKHNQYNQPNFIESDPIQVPHRFEQKEDIEIAAFLSATIAWGKREMIIKNATKMMSACHDSPYEFITSDTDFDTSAIAEFKHRTFNGLDFKFFLEALRNIYKNHGGLQAVFEFGYEKNKSLYGAISYFREVFFEINHPDRTMKHVSNPMKNSASKRICMFLMWMIRNDKRGVHFGLWDKIPASELIIPLDVHAGNTARALGLLTQKQNDRKAAEEITSKLKVFCPEDPIKYDFSLFGLGVFEGFRKS